MFKSLFGNRASGSSKSAKPRKSQKSQINGGGEENTALAGKEMMANADREIYQFEAPTQELGLSDLIAKHKAGDRFQYLALTGGDTETYEARMRRMMTFRPRANKKMIPLNDLPHMRLVQDGEEFSLQTILPKKVDEYIRLHEVSGYFAPTVSVMSKFSKVKIALMDSRYDPPAEIQSVTLNSNMDAKIELSMDYCIPKTAAPKINLMVSREQRTMATGEQWGALQAQIRLEESSFPYMSDMKRVVGILGPTASALEHHEVNPNILDITMTESNRRLLREFYQQGDVVDEGEPIIVKKKAIKYAKSSIKALPKGELAESSGLQREGWDHVQNIRKPQIAAEEASVDVDSDEGSFEGNEQLLMKTKDDWEKEQERLRKQFELLSETTEEIPRNSESDHGSLKSAMKSSKFNNLKNIDGIAKLKSQDVSDDSSTNHKKKGVAFGVSNV